jgi:bifunctional non-homologous end joining protein LigD
MPKSDKPGLRFTDPMECLLVSRLPEGPAWSYEIKLDGYRAQGLRAGEATKLLSRNGKDLAGRFASIFRDLAAAFPADSVVDGELVALDSSGKPSLSLIQNSATSGVEIVFFACDLLRHAGNDLAQLPLSERRRSSDSP